MTTTSTQRFARRRDAVARLVAAGALAAAALAVGTSTTAAAAGEGCTIFGTEPGQMIRKVAPFDGQINPGHPVGIDGPIVPALCRP